MLHRAALLFRDRVQISLARDLRSGMPEQRLHGAYRRSNTIQHRCVAVPQQVPGDIAKAQLLRSGLDDCPASFKTR